MASFHSLQDHLKLYILSSWESSSAKIKKRYFKKTTLHFGSDESCDIRLPSGRGLAARLDLEAGEIQWMEEGRLQPIAAGELFEIEGEVFQWTPMGLENPKLRSVAIATAAAVIGILVLLLVSYQHSSHTCSAGMARLASGRWFSSSAQSDAEAKLFSELGGYRKSFGEALQTKNFSKARAELDDLMGRLDEVATQNADAARCEIHRPAIELEARLSEEMMQSALDANDYNRAVDEMMRLRQRFGEVAATPAIEHLIRATRALYLEGYRTADIDPARGNAMMESARSICTGLTMPEDCFQKRKKPRDSEGKSAKAS